MRSKPLILVCILLSLHLSLGALSVPAMNGPVTDNAQLMSPDERRELAQWIERVDQETGVQIVVLTIRSLEGSNLEDFALRVFEAWKPGQKDVDNGVLLLVSLADRAVRIEVGYGLEHLVTDAKSGMIIRNTIAPRFRENKYAQGITEAVHTLASIATGKEEFAPATQEESDSRSSGGDLSGLIFFILFLFLFAGGSRRRGGWLFPFLLGSMLSSGGKHSGKGSGGGFTGGGFGGGGFSGGGGRSGGGGASGGW